MELNDILIKCDGRNFVKDRAVCDRIVTLEELLDLCEELYNEVGNLQQQLEDLEENIQDNYKPIDKAEQYGINNSDFI
jgi:ATP-dependent 26S proteasome regulatory subunit